MYNVIRKLERKVLGTAETLLDAALAFSLAVKAGEDASNLDIVKVVK